MNDKTREKRTNYSIYILYIHVYICIYVPIFMYSCIHVFMYSAIQLPLMKLILILNDLILYRSSIISIRSQRAGSYHYQLVIIVIRFVCTYTYTYYTILIWWCLQYIMFRKRNTNIACFHPYSKTRQKCPHSREIPYVVFHPLDSIKRHIPLVNPSLKTPHLVTVKCYILVVLVFLM